MVEPIVTYISERVEEKGSHGIYCAEMPKWEALYAITKHIYSAHFALQFAGRSHVLKGWFLLSGLAYVLREVACQVT